ncbi:MAG: hypothetical protein KBT35_01290 [Firmicutes bacterium]|nr:hypothetical protein [Candidatus Colivicinus equi]
MESDFTLQEFIEDNFVIRDKDSNLVNLKFNNAQLIFYEQFRLSYGNRPSRFIVLKARQLGISTLTESIISGLTMLTPNTSSVIIAHQSDSASNIFDMTKLFISELPEAMKPKQKYSNAREIVFDDDKNGLKSSIRVMVAGDATRGSTYKLAHLSEVAFWAKAKEAMNALSQAVPMTNDSLIVLESTANGFNFFYQLWEDAVNGRNDYIPIFIPWYMDKNYTKKYEGFELTQYEKDIKERFNLTLDQLQWRRWCIANNCGGDENQFRQEYPITPEEAFITTGTSVFNTELVLEHMKKIKEPIKRGYFNYNYDGLHITGIHWVDDPNGYIKIYKDKSIRPTVIGGDTAGDGEDFFTAQVLDDTGFLCATLHHQFDEDLYVKQVYCLGVYYNSLIAIECNFSTFPNRELQRLKYDKLYVREKYDQIRPDVQDKFGFRTTTVTRPVIISQLVEIVRTNIEWINDRETLQEMLSFVRINGKPQASEGTHDDLVMSLAIAYEAMGQMPKKFSLKKTRDRDEDFFNYGT